jgi:hypothetical protein
MLKTANQKIKDSFIFLAIILIAAIAGAIIYFNDLYIIRQFDAANNQIDSPSPVNFQQEVVNDGYQNYADDQLGISFVYPKWWGHVVSDANGLYFVPYSGVNINFNSGENYTDCPAKDADVSTIFGQGVSKDDILYCRNISTRDGHIVQVFIGSQSTYNGTPSNDVSVENMVFSLDQKRSALVSFNKIEELSCRNCAVSYQKFIASEKEKLSTLHSCIQGKTSIKTVGGINEAYNLCELSNNEIGFITAVDDLVQSVKVNNKGALPIVGNDRDAHGCIPSAGYSWCEQKQKCLRPFEEACTSTPVVATSTVIKYLISKEDTTKYCNGADMNSDAYRKTITVEMSSTTPETNLTEAQLAKKRAILATSGMCQNVLRGLGDFTVSSGTVSIPPIDGWAGVSITMCYCQPQVEVNLLRLPGITKVIWK